MSSIQYWNYRVVADGPADNRSFFIAEVYYDATDRYLGWVLPKPMGDSQNDLQADLEMMMEALEKPVIEMSDLPGDFITHVTFDGDEDETDKEHCPAPDGPCTCTNGIGCVNVPVSEW